MIIAMINITIRVIWLPMLARSFQVYYRYAIKEGRELFIKASLVWHPYFGMQW